MPVDGLIVGQTPAPASGCSGQLLPGPAAQLAEVTVRFGFNLVQTSWGLGTRLVSFEIAPDEDAVDLYATSRLRRAPITGVRDALSGYQDGRCAYCGAPFTDIGTSRVAVDHVLPFVSRNPQPRCAPAPALHRSDTIMVWP